MQNTFTAILLHQPTLTIIFLYVHFNIFYDTFLFIFPFTPYTPFTSYIYLLFNF